MCEGLMKLRAAALADDALRQAILQSAEAEEPLAALCAVAQTAGIELTPEDILAEGEEFSCNQTKSTNGGNPLPYDCFDDAYEMFIISLR
ncbi:MAG: hypothetical protein IJ573_10405 [Clostridia bacterium]|nr:hypothetical protein [Clostridia bacterium]